MNQQVLHVTLVVDDYDRAIEYYTRTLGFELEEDTPTAPGKRWVTVKPKGQGTCSLLLARAVGDEQRSRIGNQTGGRVFLFLGTDDFARDYQRLKDQGVTFVREPAAEAYGTVAVFEDQYGNRWDLIERS